MSQREDELAIAAEKAEYDRTIQGYEFDTVTKELMARIEVLENEFKDLLEEIAQLTCDFAQVKSQLFV